MFAKIFHQIFDSTIAENYKHRHVFMDLLVLADVTGSVDMTPAAIARHTNVPLQEVQEALEALSSPDPDSKNKDHQGRRLVPLEEGRSWGWRIVSYDHYRKIRDEEQRREYHRDYYEKKTKPKRNDPKKNGTNNGKRLMTDSKGSMRSCLHPDHPPGL